MIDYASIMGSQPIEICIELWDLNRLRFPYQ